MAIWRKDQVSINFWDDMVDHPVVTARVDTPAGELRVMAVPSQVGRTMLLTSLHMHGELTSANQVGAANLIVVVQVLMEMMDVDELFVTAGLRTTGANPGSRPRRIRFTRHIAD
jgi:hypothetical protein